MVELERRVVPVSYDGGPRDRPELRADQVAYIVQRLQNQKKDNENIYLAWGLSRQRAVTYLLACRQPLWVQLAELQAAEEELNRRC